MINKNKIISFMFVAILVASLTVSILVLASHSNSKNPPRGTIASNGVECAAIGQSIFRRGGSVADAAIATIICEGIACPQASGLGGGFLLTIYINSSKTVETLNAREIAPLLSSADMFIKKPEDSRWGGKAVAVPGALAGLWELHQKYGKLQWSELFKDNIKLARNGFVVTPYFQNTLNDYEEQLHNEKTLREIFINPATNKSFKVNDIIKNPKLATTLEMIAKDGKDLLYSEGPFLRGLVDDIQQKGGIIVEEDFLDYKARWGSSLSTTLRDNNTLHSFPLPGSGAILIFIMNLLREYELKDDALSYHRMAEAFKIAYAKKTLLGGESTEEMQKIIRNLTSKRYADKFRALIRDNETSQDFEYYGAKFFSEEDRGTGHIAILAPNGDAISVTATINDNFGSFWRSESTGIILNNQMDDFSTPGIVNLHGFPASPANAIAPGKQPLSSIVPTIIVNRSGEVRLIIGGAGGTRITTATAFCMIKHLFLNETLSDSIAIRRIHHQLSPMQLHYESNFNNEIIDTLENIYGHKVEEEQPNKFASIVGISKIDGKAEGVFDPRRGGSVEA